ncbi:MAG: inositol monophosphatase/fructose,6-bisphosphatase family protein [Mycobacterium sp.]|nr:inositol monophosphatase/fructose,6-bisphosphatase family protein [Mycobacterium sp.]
MAAAQPVSANLCCDTQVTEHDLDVTELRAVAERLATEAADFVLRRRDEVFGTTQQREGSGGAVRSKSTPTDPVTVVDTDTERLLRERLAVLRPGESVLGEEQGDAGGTAGADGVTWVLDPIDGTVNFVYGLPAYAVSVGAQVNGASVAGAVAHVSAGVVYSAALGQGAHMQESGRRTPLRCTDVDDLSMTLVGTGFGYAVDLRGQQAEVLARLLPQVRDMRRMGSAALDLCMVAAGRLDAYYESDLNVWDWAAGVLIAAEAGAWLHLPPPQGSVGGSGLVVAASPRIAADLMEALRRSGGLADSIVTPPG